MASILIVAPALGSYGLLSVFGQTGSGPGTVGSQAPAIAVDANGRVYVADVKDSRIEAFTNTGAPDGGWGDVAGVSGVAAAPDGTIVVADRAGVHRYAVDGTRLETLSTLSPVAGVAVAPDGMVYIADPVRHRVAVPGGEDIDDGLQRPSGLAIADDGTVYVSDLGDSQIHAFDADGAAGAWPAGSEPNDVAVARDGTLFVADGAGNQILHQRANGTLIESFTGVNIPRGVDTDCRGRAYVVDNSALRVRVYGEAGPPPPCPAAPQPTPPPKVEVLGEVARSEPAPLLGVRARASAVQGTVKVGAPGKLRKLGENELIPIGSTVDATDGHVKLEFETAAGADRAKYGAIMDGEFFDGEFKIEQKRNNSLVDLVLSDDDTPARKAGTARISALKKLKVWGKAHGRFRTVGRNGAATVRGTQWLTEERDDGTLFSVREGVVEVREFETGRTIVLHAGESFLTKPACISKRNFRIRLRTREGGLVTRADVRVNGKRVGVRRGRRLTAPVDLRGMPEKRVVVRIRLTTRDGRVLVGRRLYHTCSNDPLRPSRPPEL